jgi:hypothetical protein
VINGRRAPRAGWTCGATLKAVGRQHAMVIDCDEAGRRLVGRLLLDCDTCEIVKYMTILAIKLCYKAIEHHAVLQRRQECISPETG